MPWTCSIGPEALVAISAVWIIADGTRSYLQGNLRWTPIFGRADKVEL